MIYIDLKKKIKDLLKSNSTLLWLEGAKYEQVSSIQLKASTLVLSLKNGTIKLIQFDKYALTLVGIQFWNKGRPSVLYKWDIPDHGHTSSLEEKIMMVREHMPDDDPTPPNIAA